MDDDEAVENTIVFGLLGDHIKHGLAVLAGRGVHDEAVVGGTGVAVCMSVSCRLWDCLKEGDETVLAEGYYKLCARQASAGLGIM